MEPTKGGAGKYVTGIIVAVVVIVGITMYASNKSKQGDGGLPAPDTTVDTTAANVDSGSPVTKTTTVTTTTVTAPAPSKTVTVTFTNSGFSPAEVSIDLGDTVKFVNQSSENMWVASALHPSHAVYSGTTLREHCPDTSGTAFDQCGAGSTYSFTFQKVGTWAYHNHTDASKFGKVVVK